MSLIETVTFLKAGESFLLLTHKDPDVDGLGSMLALGRVLEKEKKRVLLVAEQSVPVPLSRLAGAEGIVHECDDGRGNPAALVALDCADKSRLGAPESCLSISAPLLNIDHHETNSLFGDLNLVDRESSSTGELVYEIIQKAGFSLDAEIAENLFAAIEADTGSFRYVNTTAKTMRIAAELIDQGARPWRISRDLIEETSASKLELLRAALGTVEFHCEGRVGFIGLPLEMLSKAGVCHFDSEMFVSYPRYVRGVEVAALIQEKNDRKCKVSLRSNSWVNVARLASRFGGGGHARAAGFECHGTIDDLKRRLLKEAVHFLDGKET